MSIYLLLPMNMTQYAIRHFYEHIISSTSTPPSAAKSSPLQDTLQSMSEQQTKIQFHALHANQNYGKHWGSRQLLQPLRCACRAVAWTSYSFAAALPLGK
jgi:hypothetical protein